MLGRADGLRLVADEERLPFAPESLDSAASSLALHWVNDLVGTLIQIRRALRPDGLFIGAFLGGATLTELRACLVEAEIRLRGGAGPRVSPFLDIGDAPGLLQRAGFALPVADTDLVCVTYDHPMKLLADLRAMGETSALVERPRQPLTRGLLELATGLYVERHARPGRPGDGELRDHHPHRLGSPPRPAEAAAAGLGEDAPRRRPAHARAPRGRAGRGLKQVAQPGDEGGVGGGQAE